MDATRPRRTHDEFRRSWYAKWRCIRFAIHFGFAQKESKNVQQQQASSDHQGHIQCSAGEGEAYPEGQAEVCSDEVGDQSGNDRMG
jgi:hypothetical protein